MNRTNQKIKKKEGKGITLIALVITIIVLLILAAVSIATLTGDEGILNQTGKAEDENSRASAEEQVKLAVVGSYGKNGKLDYKELKDNLNKITGIVGVPNEITDDNFPLKVKVNGYEVTINANGTVESKKEESTGKIKWEQDEITITMTDGEGTETKIGCYIKL